MPLLCEHISDDSNSPVTHWMLHYASYSSTLVSHVKRSKLIASLRPFLTDTPSATQGSLHLTVCPFIANIYFGTSECSSA